MKTLTVFTPTYNRENCLHKCYESLKRQKNTDFEWIIIDDGSTDNTKELVESWKKNDNKFEIIYYHKENGGLHTGYNKAIELANSKLCVCIDSDDFMPDDAVEKIIKFWNENGSNKYAGIMGLDFYINEECIGGRLPDKKSINLVDWAAGKYKCKLGDKKYVVRTELYKKVAPMKSFPNEKNFNPQYMHFELSKEYDFLVLNENLCFVEYQPDGMSHNMYQQYYNSPNSFRELRILLLSFSNAPISFKIRHAIHYVSNSLLAKQSIYDKRVKNKLLITIAIPPGYLLYKHTKNNVKKNKKYKSNTIDKFNDKTISKGK